MRKVSYSLSIVFVLVFLTVASAEEKTLDFGYKITTFKNKPFSISFITSGKKYKVLPSVIKADKYLMYFAAEDFTHKEQLVTNDFKEVKVIKDEKEVKGIKTIISLKDQNNKISKNYELTLSFQIRKNYPCLAVYSKLIYKGEAPAVTGLNWGITGGFKYYAYPKKGGIGARKLQITGIMKNRATKLGKGAYPWVWPTSGRGDGLGIMTVGMLEKNPLAREVEIVIADVPPKKKLSRGEFMDVPFILLPTTRKEGGYKPVLSLYKNIRNVKWEMEKW